MGICPDLVGFGRSISRLGAKTTRMRATWSWMAGIGIRCAGSEAARHLSVRMGGLIGLGWPPNIQNAFPASSSPTPNVWRPANPDAGGLVGHWGRMVDGAVPPRPDRLVDPDAVHEAVTGGCARHMTPVPRRQLLRRPRVMSTLFPPDRRPRHGSQQGSLGGTGRQSDTHAGGLRRQRSNRRPDGEISSARCAERRARTIP